MEIDRVPVSQLPSRYGIARSALYTRLKDLKIEPEKQGKKAFVFCVSTATTRCSALSYPEGWNHGRVFEAAR
jgi:hypothetical protein